MPGLRFSGKRAVGLKQQFNGIAEIVPRFFQGLTLSDGARKFFDAGDVAAPFFFGHLFVNGSKP